MFSVTVVYLLILF